jgi:hypothetical protein
MMPEATIVTAEPSPVECLLAEPTGQLPVTPAIAQQRQEQLLEWCLGALPIGDPEKFVEIFETCVQTDNDDEQDLLPRQ